MSHIKESVNKLKEKDDFYHYEEYPGDELFIKDLSKLVEHEERIKHSVKESEKEVGGGEDGEGNIAKLPDDTP